MLQTQLFQHMQLQQQQAQAQATPRQTQQSQDRGEDQKIDALVKMLTKGQTSLPNEQQSGASMVNSLLSSMNTNDLMKILPGKS